MPKSVATSNYCDLPAPTLAKLSDHAARIKALQKLALMEVGAELVAAKELCSHGQFGRWVEHECGMSCRTAQLIMGAYRLCLKNENFTHLGRSALFILGARDVPAATLTAVDAMIRAGKTPNCEKVKV